jgi:outer membrane lipoprotein-sorting protein
MNIDEIIIKYKLLEEENKKLQDELQATKEHLKKYTAPSNMKKYYENHKEEIKQKVKEYKEKTNYKYEATPEKKKEYARTAYLNKKAKLKKLEENAATENI